MASGIDSVMYTVMAYVSGVKDNERSWSGSDHYEAVRKVAEYRGRWPLATVRMTTEVYYVPKR